MKRTILIAAALGITALAGVIFVAGPMSKAQDCWTLQSIEKDAANGFDSLRGPLIDDPEYQSAPYQGAFRSFAKFSRMPDCMVIRHTDQMLLQCGIVTSVEAEAVTVHDDTLAGFDACLSSWKPEQPPADIPTPPDYSLLSAEMRQGPDDLTYALIMVREIDNKRPRWRVTMAFSVPR